MRTGPTSMVTLAALTALWAGSALAQDRPIELGVDAALTYESRGGTDVGLPAGPVSVDFPDVFDVQVPIRSVRAGFYVSEAISIEPALAFRFADVEDGGSSVTLSLFGDVLYHLPGGGSTDFFVHGGGAFQWRYINPDEDVGSPLEPALESEGNTQFGLGGGAGVNLPLVERLKLRLGVRYVHLFESEGDLLGLPSADRFSGTFGLSFFTR